MPCNKESFLHFVKGLFSVFLKKPEDTEKSFFFHPPPPPSQMVDLFINFSSCALGVFSALSSFFFRWEFLAVVVVDVVGVVVFCCLVLLLLTTTDYRLMLMVSFQSDEKGVFERERKHFLGKKNLKYRLR